MDGKTDFGSVCSIIFFRRAEIVPVRCITAYVG